MVTINAMTVVWAYQGISESVFTDSQLVQCVKEAGHGHLDPTLQTLDCSQRAIRSLEGIQWLEQLRELKLKNNQIVDLSPLQYLNNLITLDLTGNQINDLTPLAHLAQLEELYCAENQITHLNALATLDHLIILDGSNNHITDLSPLAQLIHLTDLNLANNQIIDIYPLAGIDGLIDLTLSDNQITDLYPVTALTQLVGLDVAYNLLNDIYPLNHLAKLRYLRLDNNQIDSTGPLAELTELLYLNLANNELTDINSLNLLTAETQIELAGNDNIICDQLDALDNTMEKGLNRPSSCRSLLFSPDPSVQGNSIDIVGAGQIAETFVIGGNLNYLLDLGSYTDQITITPDFQGHLIHMASFGGGDIINLEAGVTVAGGVENPDGSYFLQLSNGGSVTIAKAVNQTFRLAGVRVSYADLQVQLANGATIVGGSPVEPELPVDIAISVNNLIGTQEQDVFVIGGNLNYNLDLGGGTDQIHIRPDFSGRLNLLSNFGAPDIINLQAGIAISANVENNDGSYILELVNGGQIIIPQVGQQQLQLAGQSVSLSTFKTAMAHGVIR